MSFNPIDLGQLRNEVAGDFAAWREATCTFFEAAEQAKSARDRVAAKARELLRRQAHLSKPGLYLFFSSRMTDLADAVVYIGLVKDRAGAERMIDYLAKQISLLDPNLLELDESGATNEIRRRLRAGMLETASATLTSYVGQHMKSWRLARADRIVFSAVDSDPRSIESAETLLIRSLVEVTKKPEKLVNDKKKKAPWPPTQEMLRAGQAIALRTIQTWNLGGFPAAIARPWTQEIQRVAA